MFMKGLLVCALGLAGVFLVLALYFFTIKMLQKVKFNEESAE